MPYDISTPAAEERCRYHCNDPRCRPYGCGYRQWREANGWARTVSDQTPGESLRDLARDQDDDDGVIVTGPPS
jgi:hypothetical protein